MQGILLQITQTSVVQDTVTQVVQQVQKQTQELSLLDLTIKGGVIMIPLAILSILALYIFFERFFIIHKASRQDKSFMNNIRDFIHQGKVDAALSLSKNTDSPTARMIHKGLLRLGRPLTDINAAIETVGKLEVAKLEKGVAFLATIAGGAPMIGFLGTVVGMVQAFYNMSVSGNNIDIALLSSGIYVAMVTTVGGLIVGIMSYFCYNFIVARIQKVVNNLETLTSEFMDLLNEPAS